jgi:hypothetical protein
METEIYPRKLRQDVEKLISATLTMRLTSHNLQNTSHKWWEGTPKMLLYYQVVQKMNTNLKFMYKTASAPQAFQSVAKALQ